MIDDVADHGHRVQAPMEDCWRHVGVSGDRSCAELATFIHCRNCPVLASAARRFFSRPAPAGYLESWREILEQPEAAVDADARSVLVFRLGDEWLALPTSAVVEVTQPRPIHHVPHRSGTTLAGIVNIRGQLHLCVRLERLLGLEKPPTETAVPDQSARLLVAGHLGARWEFPDDGVDGVHRVPARSLRDVPATVSGTRSHATAALFVWQERTVGLLDDVRLLEGLDKRISG